MHSPPRFPLRFFRWFCHPELRKYIEGDLLELYEESVKQLGKHKADRKFIIDVLLLFRPGIIRNMEGSPNLNQSDMIKSYLKIGWRNLVRSKGYSLINIGGLSVSMAVALLIGLWIYNELSFNRSFKNYDRLAVLYHNLTFGDNILTVDAAPFPVGGVTRDFAEIDKAIMVTGPNDHVIGLQDKTMSRSCLFVDTAFAAAFTLRMVGGTLDGLRELHSIMLSHSLAQALVGNDPIGKLVKFDNQDQLLVTGVYQDFPSNSQFAEVKMLLPLNYYFSQSEDNSSQKDKWGAFNFSCFLLRDENASWEEIESKIKTYVFDHTDEIGKELHPQALVHPMSRWHLYGEFDEGKNVKSKMQFVWMFGAIGVFVLLLACINFVNLSTARSEKRSKEVGLRKVMGSYRNQLVGQFMSESFLVVILAFIGAIALSTLSLPSFNNLAGTLILIPWTNPYFVGTALGFMLLTGLLAGSYPALYLSGFNPIQALKGTTRGGSPRAIIRKILVVFQFTISTTLMITTVIVFRQIQYAKDRPLGFDVENILFVPVRTSNLARADYNSIRHELLQTGLAENMAKSDFPVTGGAMGEASITWEGKDADEHPLIAMNGCSHDFPGTNGFQFLAGRDFSRDHVSDSASLIVNEMAADLISPHESPLGKKVTWWGKEREIIGVIKDQVRWSPFTRQTPHLYFLNYDYNGFLTIRLKANANTQEALSRIEEILKKYDPGAPFEYTFQENDYDRLFKSEVQVRNLASLFATLAVFISCMGILGLASFAASRRNKEIGIRKVLGASAFRIWKMLTSDFVTLIFVSAWVACPVAWYFAHQWLMQYEYRINISWDVFLETYLALLVITLSVVSYHAIKAAITNPVNSLKSE